MSAFTLELLPGQVGMIGYGSLISRSSMERTLGRSYDGPVKECLLPGWRRRWDVAMPNRRFFAAEDGLRHYPAAILYLNVGPQAGSVLNALIFVVTLDDLSAFDEREWIYDRVDVTDAISNGRVDGGRAYMYVGKSDHTVLPPLRAMQAAVRKTYLHILEAGLSEQSESFRDRYHGSTDQTPAHLVIDDEVADEK